MQVIDYIDSCRLQFKMLPPEEVAFPRSVSDVRKYKCPLASMQGNTHPRSWCSSLSTSTYKKNGLDKKVLSNHY